MKKLKMGMIGGGPGSLIGAVHRLAAERDGYIELVAGVFSQDFEKTKKLGEELGIDPSRLYPDYIAMFKEELYKPEGERLDIISIVTPNHLHFEQAKLALESKFHVVCDKPLTVTHQQAAELERISKEFRKEFAVTYTYTGYPMVKEARAMVQNGELGEVRKVMVEYVQGWLSKEIESEGHKQASWRTDPSKSGKVGALGDIGVHAFNLVEYVCDTKVEEVCTELNTTIASRSLEDDNNSFIHLDNGAKGTLISSQVCIGEENNLSMRIYGDKASLEWRQMESEKLIIRYSDRPMKVLKAGTDQLSEIAQQNVRLPGGHPEGFNEAFANIYRNFAKTLITKRNGKQPTQVDLDFPKAEDGVRGMLFIEKALESNASGQKWVSLKQPELIN
ncbi:MAG: Gfo/Idh/MocA family oxidoreductase [Bacteroidota bacterium]